MSVLPPQAAKRYKLWFLRALIVVLVGLSLIGVVLWEKLLHKYPQQLPENVANSEFKYGSIGIEESAGIPYWIWLVLPQIFPEHLPGPGGYTSLGMLWEPGSEMPIGFSKRRIGYERVGFNCAACHVGSYRRVGDDHRTTNTNLVVGAPANKFDVQGYLHFLGACANDPRFNADTILSAIEYNTKLSGLDKALFRYVLIPGTQKALLAQEKSAQWMRTRPPWGTGRIDPFNPVKFGMLRMNPANDTSVGNSDMMPLWAMDKRESANGFHLHWDGLSTNLVHCSLAGALGDGATPKSLPVRRIQKLVEELRYMPPPASPLKVDESLAADGRVLFDQHCGRCHAPEGPDVNRPYDFSKEPNTKNVTDGNRLAMWNVVDSNGQAPFQIYNAFADGYTWDLNSFVATKSYVSIPLSGVWAIGPYLHNGSVPTIADLLNPPQTIEDTKRMMDELGPGMCEQLVNHFSSIDNAIQFGHNNLDERKQLREFVGKVVKQSRKLGVRPPVFFRGVDVLDEQRVGFVADGSNATERNAPFLYVTFVQGNSNVGHLYGTELTDEQKQALVEYLKDYSSDRGQHDK